MTEPEDQPYRPEGVHTVTPYLTIAGAGAAIEFYKKAFGAEERYRLAGPDGTIEHATLRIGDSIVYLADELGSGQSPTALGGSTVAMHLYVRDCDAVWKQALDTGATPVIPLDDQPWGDRYGEVKDPFGHLWGISTMKR